MQHDTTRHDQQHDTTNDTTRPTTQHDTTRHDTTRHDTTQHACGSDVCRFSFLWCSVSLTWARAEEPQVKGHFPGPRDMGVANVVGDTCLLYGGYSLPRVSVFGVSRVSCVSCVPCVVSFLVARVLRLFFFKPQIQWRFALLSCGLLGAQVRQGGLRQAPGASGIVRAHVSAFHIFCTISTKFEMIKLHSVARIKSNKCSAWNIRPTQLH
jgi:hypothetical protein